MGSTKQRICFTISAAADAPPVRIRTQSELWEPLLLPFPLSHLTSLPTCGLSLAAPAEPSAANAAERTARVASAPIRIHGTPCTYLK